ncbi:MAG: tRNA (adenosine(37)-N6)-dimethylallyltransferase MiaA [Acidobacteriia bacterium]|nr:tRNA (adenosine(37)-N6)-dimethylallyltransferase MiaA [Terriglobia bacterium]
MAHPAIAVVGPTGSGKSDLGMALAERFHGEIITCDALQVYRHMDIGTAKPGTDECEKIPHHMLDLREPCDDFSAGDYLRCGREALHVIRARGRIPFVVGGTGFYLRALIEGLFEGPGRSDVLRSRMRRIMARRGPESIHRALRRVDPETAARLAPADAERNIRAYEIYLLSGHTMNWWQRRPKNSLQGFRWLKVGILWPRALLYARIDQRVEEMFRRGFVAEVETLIARYPRDCQAFKAIGYRQIAGHLEGKWSLEQALEDTQRESRRYAKRQLTWFRADQEIVWVDPTPGTEALLDRSSAEVARFLG